MTTEPQKSSKNPATNGNGRWHYPATKTVDKTDTYFGQTINDPYRWIESIEDAEVTEWFKIQAAYANEVIGRIPGQQTLVSELLDYDRVKPVKYGIVIKRGDSYFFEKRLAGEEAFKIYKRNGMEGEDLLLFDPLAYTKDKVMEVSWDVNDDATLLLLNLTEQGRERGFIQIKNLESGEFLTEKILFSRGGFVDGSTDTVIYLKQKNDNVHDPDNNLNCKLKLHKTGTAEDDDLELLSNTKYPQLDILPEDYPWVATLSNSNYIIGGKGNVNDNIETFYAPKEELEQPQINWKPLTCYADEIKSFVARGNDVYFLTSKSSDQLSIIKTNLKAPDISGATEIFSGGDWKIESIDELKDYLLITLARNGVEFAVKKMNFNTGKIENVSLSLQGTLIIKPYNNQTNECALFNSSWTLPANLYHLDVAAGQVEKGGFFVDCVYEGSENLVAEEIQVPSHDGTLVPLSIIYDKTLLKKDGSNIGFISGYGAYGMSPYKPLLIPNNLLMAKRGLVIAYAHVRGGGEKGESWHIAGKKKTKPNTWKDFNACAEYLIQNKYTSSAKIACTGGSAGGILIGRAITERPDLYRVAIPKVGSMNALRGEFSPNGPVNVPEFGTLKNEEEFHALVEMDALLHIRASDSYPAQLITTGFNDPRVISWQPAKFAAAMQAANASAHPVLLYVNYKGGHFGGSTVTEQFEEFARQFAFLLWQCGDPAFQPEV